MQPVLLGMKQREWMNPDKDYKYKPQRRNTGQVPVLLVFALVACTIVLFGTVIHNSKPAGSATVSYYQQDTGAGGRVYHAHVHSQNASSAAAGDGADLKLMLKSMQRMQEQLTALQTTLPSTIEQEVKEHSGPAAQPQQQQPQPQQQPPVDPSRARIPQQPVMLPKPQHVGLARSACDTHSASGIRLPPADLMVAPVVIVAHNRVHYLAKCLMTVLRYWSADPANVERFPLFVSVDGGDPATMQFAAALNYGADVQVIHNLRDSTRCLPNQGYCNLSLHYQMLLQLFFQCHKAPRLLFLEEDLEVSPDFFSYFGALAPLLQRDKSLMCVSAWNDHGQRGRASNSSEIYRTDIFPGLGWMLSADFGMEIHDNWPNIYWDEYMRTPQVRKGRQCIFPEVPRTHTFGRDGTSRGQFFDKHLTIMSLNQENIDWSKQDLSFLEGPAYAKVMAGWLAAAKPVDASIDLAAYCAVGEPDDTEESGDMVLRFSTDAQFTQLAGKLPPMLTDTKGGPVGPGNPLVPRAAYKGIAIVRCRGRRLFLAPEPGSAAEPSSVYVAAAAAADGQASNTTAAAATTEAAVAAAAAGTLKRNSFGRYILH